MNSQKRIKLGFNLGSINNQLIPLTDQSAMIQQVLCGTTPFV